MKLALDSIYLAWRKRETEISTQFANYQHIEWL